MNKEELQDINKMLDEARGAMDKINEEENRKQMEEERKMKME